VCDYFFRGCYACVRIIYIVGSKVVTDIVLCCVELFECAFLIATFLKSVVFVIVVM